MNFEILSNLVLCVIDICKLEILIMINNVIYFFDVYVLLFGQKNEDNKV